MDRKMIYIIGRGYPCEDPWEVRRRYAKMDMDDKLDVMADALIFLSGVDDTEENIAYSLAKDLIEAGLDMKYLNKAMEDMDTAFDQGSEGWTREGDGDEATLGFYEEVERCPSPS